MPKILDFFAIIACGVHLYGAREVGAVVGNVVGEVGAIVGEVGAIVGNSVGGVSQRDWKCR